MASFFTGLFSQMDQQLEDQNVTLFRMASWRMQLHPSVPGESAFHSTQSLSRGFVGLDFREDVGDLVRVDYDSLPSSQKNYWAFAHEMAEGDHVLIFVHNYPFALAIIDGPYNYIRTPVPEIGVWFRHFRAVRDVRYYSDFRTNPNTWKQLTMTATITPLRNDGTGSQQLIDEWLGS